MKQIYTGYQWRPMTEAELEIMEASRIVDEMTDDAQAGDIYEGAPEKCLYCIGDKNASRSLTGEDDNAYVYLHYNSLVVETYDPHGMPDDTEAAINYCPMCGRKLEEVE